MTAQQPQHAPVRLLIAEHSENAAHEFDSLLRDAGIATRAEIIDLSMASNAMAEADMLLANSALPELQQMLPGLRKKAPDVPIILINPEESDLTTAQGMQLGAADVVPKSEPEQLVLVVKRELEHVCQVNRLSQTRRALKEAERRCQLLLQSSQAAIAYVHEGMHIYANEGYLHLFGFDDAEELLGLPLMDLLDGASANALKIALKRFRKDEDEKVLDFAGQSTKGNKVCGNMTLAAAEYEGEHCIQVTMRTSDPLADDEPIPTLTAEPHTTNGAAADKTDAADMEEPADIEDAGMEDAAELEDVVAELEDVAVLEDVAEPEAAAEPEAPAEPKVAVEPEAAPPRNTGDEHDLPEFLNAAIALIGAAGADSFSGIFAAEIDDFAQLQRDHGLAGGADICSKVQAHLLEHLGDSPLVRLANYQFAFAISGPTRASVLAEVDGFRAELEGLILEINAKTVRPTMTFGGAEFEIDDGSNLTQAMEACLDRAFATTRAAIDEFDGNCVELTSAEIAADGDPDAEDEAGRTLCLINEAIENQRFVLLFQPIISLRGDSDEHYEVFLRMLDREGKHMSPGEFLRTAIDNNVAGKIDRWVILQSIKMLSTHRSKGHNTRLTINLTCNSVADPEFIQWLGVAIKAARLPSDAVIFQITEEDASTYIRQTREFVEGLKQMHCRASLSRFGISADPFEILSHIPAEFVKLDGAKIESMGNDENMRETITDMIRDLQSAGKLTIVPMVESANVLSALWQAGANYIQGHYLQEPSVEMDYDFSTDD